MILGLQAAEIICLEACCDDDECWGMDDILLLI